MRTSRALQPDDSLLTSDVARLFRVSGETVRDWERQGRLPAIRTIGGVRIFSGHDVLRLQRDRAGVNG